MNDILVSADFLMTRVSTQEYHLRWFSDLIRRPIEWAVGKRVVVFYEGESRFKRSVFFSLSGKNIDDGDVDTHLWFDDKEINDDSISYLKKSFLNCGVLIGYELSIQTRTILNRAGIKYIDVWLHPIRFMDDNLYCFDSNCTEIRRALFEFNLSEKKYYLYADRFRISNYRGWNKKEIEIDNEIKDDSALFIGQTLTDKAICQRGKMLSLIDFKPQFALACSRFSHVYYSRHPMLRGDDSKIVEFVNSFENASIIDVPSYYLLCSRKIKKVFSISSSVVTEAKYFDKETEYLYQPVVRIGLVNEVDAYSSVFEDYISPHFWSSVLGSVYAPLSTEKINFFHHENKIRDMLGLYYNSHTFNRVDMIFNGDGVNKTSSLKVKSKNSNDYLVSPNQVTFERFTKKVERADVVSFDVFDTLIERPVSRPSSVFELMSRKVFEISSGKIDNFKEIRLNSKRMVIKKDDFEEVSLVQRYDTIKEHYSISEDEAKKIHDYELEVEYSISRRKEIGWQMFNYALKKGKKIIIVSDTFYTKEFVESLLLKNGYSGYDDLYVSSEHGLLKETGSVYPMLIRKQMVCAEKILHIGDNKKADIVQADRYGISTFYIPTSFECAKKLTKTIDATCFIDKNVESLVHGLQARNLAKYPMITMDHGFTSGSVDKLGYSIFGPMFFGFAKHIIERSIANKHNKIYFLARDGEIAKKSYDILRSYYPEAPESEYLLASRRAINIASLQSEKDIKAFVNQAISDLAKNPSPCLLHEFIKSRFGLNGDELSVFPIIHKLMDKKLSEVDLNELGAVFYDKHFFDKIRENAEQERTLLLSYFNSVGLHKDATNIAFVDIGHNGTMQKGLSELLNLKNTHGYYFVTYPGIEKNLSKEYGHTHSGFFREFINDLDKNDVYISNALVFESAFLNDKGSFIRFKYEDGGLISEFTNTDKEAKRVQFSHSLHKGIERFVRDFSCTLGYLIKSISVTPDEWCAPVSAYLSEPSYRDAICFSGVTLENYFSGRSVRYIVPTKKNINQSGLWRNGTAVFKNNSSSVDMASYEKKRVPEKANVSKVFKLLARKVLSRRKYTKLINDPELFFKDSNFIFASTLKKLFVF